jgi:arsenate reductase (glutaredoxin)
MTILYQYPKCSTCRKAARWLEARGVAFEPKDLVASPPSAKELAGLLARSGLPVPRFFNTSGESYRAGGFKDRLRSMSEREALAALAADGKLIKRPILVTERQVLVGWDEAAWAAALG